MPWKINSGNTRFHLSTSTLLYKRRKVFLAPETPFIVPFPSKPWATSQAENRNEAVGIILHITHLDCLRFVSLFSSLCFLCQRLVTRYRTKYSLTKDRSGAACRRTRGPHTLFVYVTPNSQHIDLPKWCCRVYTVYSLPGQSLRP